MTLTPRAFTFLALLLMLDTGSTIQPIIFCPEFVDEWGTLQCECRVHYSVVPPPVITWPGHSDSFALEKANITREDNGTQYTCLVQSDDINNTAVYTLQVAYGPSKEDTHISGPDLFVTNGTQTLTLSCLTSNTHPPHLSYTWYGVGVTCQEGNTRSNCSFRPQAPWDDGKRVTCRASNTAGQTVVTAIAEFVLNLTYPPMSPPAISGFTAGEVLRKGDNLTCTIYGGKPPVSEILFSCTDPYLEDQPDTADQSSVSSTVTVESMNATGEDTECTCNGYWEESAHNVTYQLRSSVTLQIEYAAAVTRFTINNVTDVLKANESDHTTLTLECTALGQPAPVLTLSKVGQTPQPSENQYSSGLVTTSVVIPNGSCEDIGTYVCSAKNGFVDLKSAKIIVNCAPTLRHHEGDSNMPELTSGGLSFTLRAYPPPHSFTWQQRLQDAHNYSSDPSTHTTTASRDWEYGADPAQYSGDLSEIFSIVCEQSGVEEYLVLCKVRAINITRTQPGVYSVSIANGYGAFAYSFEVKGEREGATKPQTEPGGGNTLIIIAVGVSAAVVVLAVISIVSIYHCRRKEEREYHSNSRKRPDKNRSDANPELQDQSRFHDNQGYDAESPASQSAPSHGNLGAGAVQTRNDSNAKAHTEVGYASPEDLNLHPAQSSPETS